MTISRTDNLEHALFTRAEMERRWNVTRDMMSAEGIDALMVTGEENFQYFAGARGGILGIPKQTKSFGHVCQGDHPWRAKSCSLFEKVPRPLAIQIATCESRRILFPKSMRATWEPGYS